MAEEKDLVKALMKDDVVIYVIFKALTQAVRLGVLDASGQAKPATHDEVRQAIELLLLDAVQSGFVGLNAGVILEKLKLGERLDLAMDRLKISEPHALRVIGGGAAGSTKDRL